MIYDVGQQEAIQILDLVDRAGVPVNGETGTWRCVDPEGTVTTGSTTNPGGGNDYEALITTFDRHGRWHVHVAFTTPNTAQSFVFHVRYSPAAPVPP